MIFILYFILFLTIMLSFIVFFSAFKNFKENQNKIMPFECGFDAISSNRLPFSMYFFKICLIFIVFDIEIAILIPMPEILFYQFNDYIMFMIFMAIFFLSLLFEWQQNAIKWKN